MRQLLPVDLPEHVRKIQHEALEELGVSITDSKAIAQSVRKLSDFYLNFPEKSSPWFESWAQIAYLAYYMPLNWWRLCGVVTRGLELDFFKGFDSLLEFGSGLGSLGMAFDFAGVDFSSSRFIERSQEAIALHKRLMGNRFIGNSGDSGQFAWQTSGSPKVLPRSLAAFSYSFTEIESLPSWALECDGLMIVEPSTQNDSRRLQRLRDRLIAEGWYVWGPCTHAARCPLIALSERDWCHDRFQWEQPTWLKNIEAFMPIKNGSLPCSWLMMKKSDPVQNRSGLSRMTGDLQEFKGYAKQLVCRGENREFVSWQKRYFKKSYPRFGRGDLVRIADGIEVKSGEIKPKSDSDIERI